MRLQIISDTYPPDINGVARTLRTLSAGLIANGHQVEVVTTVAEDPREPDLDPLSRQVTLSMPLPGYPGLRLGLASTRYLMGLMESFRPDVVYTATETALGIASIRAASKLGIPVVSGFHTNFHTYLEDYHLPGLDAVAQAFLRTVHNQTAKTLTPSQDAADMLRGWGIQDVAVLGRGVETDLFHPAKRSLELRASWGAGEDTPVAIYVGRIAAEKNLGLLMRAFDAFRDVHPEARCVLVGNGPKLAWLEAEFPNCHYAGVRLGEDLAAHYASGDVFIFPSLTETFGNVVTEAMASGLNAVAFDYAAPRQFIRDGTNGFLAPFGDEILFLEQVRHAAERWSDQPLRTAARETALSLSWQRVVDQFERELLSVCRPSTLSPDTTPSTKP